jgi:uncharacterized membrane protein YcaP (DUF421 family)
MKNPTKPERMKNVSGINWSQMFLPGTPVLEIFLRGTVMYLALFLLLRFVLKRESGTVGITDLLVIVLIADAAQNAMADDYKSLPDGLLLVATIVLWAYFLNWLAYRVPFIQRLLVAPPLELVRDGRELPRNLRRELVTHEELISQLRLQGIETLQDVKKAYMEPDGRISVIKRNGGETNGKANERRGT